MVVQFEQSTEYTPPPDNRAAEWDDPAPAHVTLNDLLSPAISVMPPHACTRASGLDAACGEWVQPYKTPLKHDNTASHAPPDMHYACLPAYYLHEEGGA